MFRPSARVGVDELLVPLGTEKCVRREQGAGADDRDDGKARTCSCVRQPHQGAGAERPICAPTRECEDAEGFSAWLLMSASRDTSYGYFGESVIGAHHSYVTRRLSRDIGLLSR